jgi:Predicted integral membrane protein (DUF2269)
MPAVVAVALFEVVLAVHIMAVVVAFGVTFAYPIMFSVGAKGDPRSMPLLHRIEYSIERRLTNPGLLIVLLAGIYLASKLHVWSAFYVQWGLAAVVVIGAVVGAVMIPTAKRAEELAERDLAASNDETISFSEEYRALTRRLATVGTLLSLLVLVTVYFMATHTGA